MQAAVAGALLGRERLLDQLDPERPKLRHELHGRVHRPGLVRVDPDQRVGRLCANGANALEIGRPAHLDLECVVRRGRGCAPGRALDRVDRDGVAGRRWRRIEAENTPERLAAHLPEQVVERPVDGALRGHLAGDLADAAEDRPDRQRVVAEQRLDPAEEAPSRFRSTRRSGCRARPRRSRRGRRGGSRPAPPRELVSALREMTNGSEYSSSNTRQESSTRTSLSDAHALR